MDARESTGTAGETASDEDGQDIRSILTGLLAPQKHLNPKYFYDQRGSALFEQITQLPEYYPARTEITLLKMHCAAIAEQVGSNIDLVEPGAGNCEKVRYLLDALRPSRYLPMDISTDFLRKAVGQLREEFPWLEVQPLTADFSRELQLPPVLPPRRAVVFYPGSTIGNFEPARAVDFMAQVAAYIRPDGGLLLGVDLHKDPAVLHGAYNDSQGITAAFNRNVLNHLNHSLGTSFDPADFEHHAFYNESARRIEMHLRCRRDHTVTLNGHTIAFRQGETIHTENSYKYTLDDIGQLAKQAGMTLVQSWVDDEQLFSINYLSPR